MTEGAVLTVADVALDSLHALLKRYQLDLVVESDTASITGSFWGGAEAGIVGTTVYVRSDTPVHSLLHEACHIICMSGPRRNALHRDAGGDDLEESAVCYLQVLLADYLEGVGCERIMRDMDSWGYSFRLGSTRRWFEEDADDSRAWLATHTVLAASGEPNFQLRQ